MFLEQSPKFCVFSLLIPRRSEVVLQYKRYSLQSNFAPDFGDHKLIWRLVSVIIFSPLSFCICCMENIAVDLPVWNLMHGKCCH
jgi:hypothetical protein